MEAVLLHGLWAGGRGASCHHGEGVRPTPAVACRLSSWSLRAAASCEHQGSPRSPCWPRQRTRWANEPRSPRSPMWRGQTGGAATCVGDLTLQRPQPLLLPCHPLKEQTVSVCKFSEVRPGPHVWRLQPPLAAGGILRHPSLLVTLSLLASISDTPAVRSASPSRRPEAGVPRGQLPSSLRTPILT